MSTLLTTKLYTPPPHPNLVVRPRLIERLDEGLRLGHKLILVSAPAGFGKTTLMSEWIAYRDRPAAWLSLDEGDNDPARFLAYLVAALQRIEENVGQGVLDALQSPQPPPLEDLLTVLVNQINAIPGTGDPAGGPFVLVLDDYHLITAQPVHHALTFLCDHLPENMHLAVATRIDPPLPIARLRGRGQLTELRQADLRFTPDEAAEFLSRAAGLKLAAGDAAALASRTEGWIAGLQMAALSMQGKEDASGFVTAFTGSNRYILEYLLEEVLLREPEHIQEFLLQTSILDRLSGPLCDSLIRSFADSPTCSFADSQATLEHLERGNLFIVPLDGERRWYRYHRLFADLLRKRLHQAQPDLVPVLHRRASQWHEQNGLTTPATEHALSAGDFERAARLIEALAETLWARGEQTTLAAWLKALPEEQVTSRPRLCVAHAMVLSMAGQFDAAERRLQAAEGAAGSSTAGMELQGMVAAARALMAYFQGDPTTIIRCSRRALEALPEENTLWRSSAAVNLGDACRWSGDMAAANQAYEEAMRIGRASGNIFLITLVSTKQTLIQMQQGRLRRALEICRQQLQLLEENGLSQTPTAASAFAIWGEILREWNDLDEAYRHARKACELSEQGRSVGLHGMSLTILLKVLLSMHDTAGVAEAIRRLERLVQESDVPVWIASGLAAWKAHIWVAQGRLEEAEQLLQERGVSTGDDIAYPRTAEYMVLARLLTARGRAEEATGLLARLLREAEAGGEGAWVIGLAILHALTLQAQDDVDRALASLEQALSLAEPEGYVRIFVDEGLAMAELLRQAASRGIAPEYASGLLAAFDVPGQGARPQPLVEPLSERELEVLRLLAEGLSNPEIARELVIARSTVRSHVKNIYGKLNVHKRWDAAQRAKDLGLL